MSLPVRQKIDTVLLMRISPVNQHINKKYSYLMSTFLLNRVAVWTQGVPWKIWGHRAQSGWRSNTKSVFGCEWWMWYPRRVLGNSHKKPHAFPQEHLNWEQKWVKWCQLFGGTARLLNLTNVCQQPHMLHATFFKLEFFYIFASWVGGNNQLVGFKHELDWIYVCFSQEIVFQLQNAIGNFFLTHT